MFNSFWAGARRRMPGRFRDYRISSAKPPISGFSATPPISESSATPPVSRPSDTIVRLALCVCFCAALWAVAHHGVGFYLDRAHSKGGRIYRVNSYEQFMKINEGRMSMIETELTNISGENLGKDKQMFS